MNLEAHIRKLARNNFWQEIYFHSKESSGIYLFENKSNFSGIQYIFLYWLRIYSILYSELAQKDWDNLDKDVIEDDIRCDAFLYYRSKEQEKKIQEYKKDEKKSKHKKGKDVTDYPIYKGKKEGK
jgi:hypothetical protein